MKRERILLSKYKVQGVNYRDWPPSVFFSLHLSWKWLALHLDGKIFPSFSDIITIVEAIMTTWRHLTLFLHHDRTENLYLDSYQYSHNLIIFLQCDGEVEELLKGKGKGWSLGREGWSGDRWSSSFFSFFFFFFVTSLELENCFVLSSWPCSTVYVAEKCIYWIYRS